MAGDAVLRVCNSFCTSSGMWEKVGDVDADTDTDASSETDSKLGCDGEGDDDDDDDGARTKFTSFWLVSRV